MGNVGLGSAGGGGVSPLLRHILSGSSQSALNLAERFGGQGGIFETKSLNDTIIFKFPIDRNEFFGSYKSARSPLTDRDGADLDDIPMIETGIYIPYNRDDLWRGGSAIYLRSAGFEFALKTHLGVPQDLWRSLDGRDINILRTIDKSPSLDPFLLRLALAEWAGPELDKMLAKTDAEYAAIRALLYQKLDPIFEKAGGIEKSKAASREWMMAALWDPSLPEARHFVLAFGLNPDRTAAIFEAWRGLCFYQWKIKKLFSSVAVIIEWLGSANSLPFDCIKGTANWEQVKMFREANRTRILDLSKRAKHIFDDYESCHSKFVAKNDPTNFRMFLETVHSKFWCLGYAITALSNVVHIAENSGIFDNKKRLSTVQINGLYSRMSMCFVRSSLSNFTK